MIVASEVTKADVERKSGILAATFELEIYNHIYEMNWRILLVIECWNKVVAQR
jgi:hypothetical protein